MKKLAAYVAIFTAGVTCGWVLVGLGLLSYLPEVVSGTNRPEQARTMLAMLEFSLVAVALGAAYVLLKRKEDDRR